MADPNQPPPTAPAGTMERCPSCSTPKAGKFCPACGEKFVDDDDLSLLSFIKDAFHFQTNLDNRVVATITHLIRHPGWLTQYWLQGKRRDFAKPIQLFVVVNLIFFMFASDLGILLFTVAGYSKQGGLPGIPLADILAKQAELGYTPEQFIRAINLGLESHKKWLFLVLIPMTTIVLWVLHPRRKFIGHLVFAIHYATYFLVFMFALGLSMKLLFSVSENEWLVRIAAVGFTATLIYYLVLAIRCVYEVRWPRAVLESLLVAFAFVPSVMLAERLAYFFAFRSL